MAIPAHDAKRIHQGAQKAGIGDDTLAAWTAEAGGYRFAITNETGALNRRCADQVETRIKKHVQQREHQVQVAATEAARTSPPPAPGTPLATPLQVDYILSLLEQRRITGETGGFFLQGPTDPDEIANLTKQEASTYITSLKGDY